MSGPRNKNRHPLMCTEVQPANQCLLPRPSNIFGPFEPALYCTSPDSVANTGALMTPAGDSGSQTLPGRAFLFVLADEVLPSGKVVRKVLAVPPESYAQYVAANPELFGIQPRNPGGLVSLGEHALGNNNSPYSSASTRSGGASNISGRPVYIDRAKAEAAGVTIHSTEEIVDDLNRLASEQPHLKGRIERLKEVITRVEGEVLLEGEVPKIAIKSQSSMMATRGLRFIQAVGFVLTAYDLGTATVESIQEESAAPIAAETIRQAGGWGGAWLGVKVGGALGAAVGIETGPGAIVTAGVGALVFGAAGYFGADWVADFIDEN